MDPFWLIKIEIRQMSSLFLSLMFNIKSSIHTSLSGYLEISYIEQSLLITSVSGLVHIFPSQIMSATFVRLVQMA